MKRSTAGLAIACFVSLGARCGEQELVEGLARRDSAGIAIVHYTLPERPRSCAMTDEPTVTIGARDGAPPYLLSGVVDATRLASKSIAVLLDGTSEVRMFDSTGSFVRAFGRRGEGPGEFRSVWRIWALGSDTLVIGDYRPWRLHYFTSSGDYIRTVIPEPVSINRPRAAEVLSDGSIVVGQVCCPSSQPGFHPQQLIITLHSPLGELRDTIGVYPYGSWGYLPGSGRDASLMAPLFESATSVTSYDSTLVIGDQTRQELLLLRGDLHPWMVIRWDMGGPAGMRTVRPEDVDAYRRRRLAQVNPSIRQFVEEDISPRRPARESFPAFASLSATRDGAIWLRRYPRPDEADRDTYLVLGTDEYVACSAHLPAQAELLEAGPDFALLLELDEYDVQRVTQYRMTAPTSGSR